MADIYHELTIEAAPERVFEAFATPAGLNRWWTKDSSGEPKPEAEYTLFFGTDYDWRARVTRCVHNKEFELQITQAHPDWMRTRIGCSLEHDGAATRVRFYHIGWPEENEHWRVSCYCWAMYLRLMRRYLMYGETVRYEDRLDA